MNCMKFVAGLPEEYVLMSPSPPRSRLLWTLMMASDAARV